MKAANDDHFEVRPAIVAMTRKEKIELIRGCLARAEARLKKPDLTEAMRDRVLRQVHFCRSSLEWLSPLGQRRYWAKYEKLRRRLRELIDE